nr:hypothetical protein [Propionibacteriales bacterium]
MGENSRPPGGGRFRYGTWRGGTDPLAAPFDVRAAVDEIGQDVLAGRSLREALQEFLRRGADGRRGLDELRSDVRRRRRQLQRSGNMAGMLDRVRAMLDQALAAERESLAEDPSDASRLARMSLDALPDDTAGAVRDLGDYNWRSAQAREQYEQIQRLLRREVLDAQFTGMRQALSSENPEAMQRVRDMLADLNELLASHARGEDSSEQFAQFMQRHGEFFPESPKDTDDLVD